MNKTVDILALEIYCSNPMSKENVSLGIRNHPFIKTPMLDFGDLNSFLVQLEKLAVKHIW